MDVTRVVPRAGFVVAVSMVLALATASAASAQSTVGKNAGGNGSSTRTRPRTSTRCSSTGPRTRASGENEHAIGFTGGTAPISNGTGCSDVGALIFCGSNMESLVATLGGGDTGSI